MPIRKSLLFLSGVLLLVIGTADAGLEIRATSPEAVDGVVPIMAADSFHIDIWMNNTVESSELCGGGFSFQIYSPDASIESVIHVQTTGGRASTLSIEYLNGFKSDIFDVATLTDENGWGESSTPPYSTGVLPDSINFTFAGMGCLSDDLPDQEYIRFNLRTESGGRICIDSISHQSNSDWDWLFEEKFDPVTFGGPYCWDIGSGEDEPPVLTCPDDITMECEESTDPSNTGFASAVDDFDPDPTLNYSDAVAGNCPTVISRTWTAVDNNGNTSDPCVQTITVEDTTPPEITCPDDIMVLEGESTDPSETGEATAKDNCDSAPEITYLDDSSEEEFITRTWTATDSCGNSSECEQIITINPATDINDGNWRAIPEEFALAQNWPNPFNPSTNIELALPTASEWNLTIYNIAGQKVESFSGHHEAGYVTISWNAKNQSSGVYFYKVIAGEFSSTRKMLLLK